MKLSLYLCVLISLFAFIDVAQAQFFDPLDFSSDDNYTPVEPESTYLGILQPIPINDNTSITDFIFSSVYIKTVQDLYWTSYYNTPSANVVPVELPSFSQVSSFKDTIGSNWYVEESGANVLIPLCLSFFTLLLL